MRDKAPAVGVTSLLAEAMTRRTAATALLVDGAAISYGRLLARIGDYQSFARRIGLGAEDRVVFRGQPCADLYAALLAGIFGAFTISVVGAELPADSEKELLTALDPRLLIDGPGTVGGRRTDDGFGQLSVSALKVGSVRSDGPSTREASWAHQSVTSGTLGTPTAALVDSAGLAAFLRWAREALCLAADDCWFECAEPCSDLALTNALMAFSTGATFSVATGRRRLLPVGGAEAAGATVMRIVPAAGRLLLREAAHRRATLPGLRLLAFGGDVLPAELPAALLRALGSTARTMGTYGKTETAGFVLAHWFDAKALRPGAAVPLGAPVPGTSVRIDGRDGRTGELVVTSPSVALALTRCTRPPTPLMRKSVAGAPATLRTGDVVTRDGDQLRFIGRADREVKVNGVRVNLSELEQRIGFRTGERTCVLMVDGMLVALVESTRNISRQRLATQMAGDVPASLVPEIVTTIDKLPDNRGGKVDLGRCRQLLAQRIGRAGYRSRPQPGG